ncbi:MAG: helix-turn-helix transcriptional regulator [Candidatus Vecturithrix sp.]|jgi:DNA-binding CsgD family transcriptional regulator|nr:helix-turn-helix transcriptional regulator [Candidatus Vecturithrix sp.]
MKHLYVVYFFTSLLVGAISSGIAIFVYRKNKDQTIRYYLYFYLPFTLVVVFYTALTYIEANVPTISPRILAFLEYCATISLLSLMFAVPVAVHYLSSVPRPNLRNAIVGGLAGLAYLSYNIVEFIITAAGVTRVGEYLISALFMGVMIYSIVVDIMYHHNIADPVKKSLERKGTMLFGLSLPGLMSDLFLADLFPFRFYPILYCGFSVFFTYYFLTSYIQHAHGPVQTNPPDDFFARYHLSPREQELITLVLKGYSNQKIAETLYISLHTVKAHLRNIYPKLGIKSRYELIALIREPQGTLPE